MEINGVIFSLINLRITKLFQRYYKASHLKSTFPQCNWPCKVSKHDVLIRNPYQSNLQPHRGRIISKTFSLSRRLQFSCEKANNFKKEFIFLILLHGNSQVYLNENFLLLPDLIHMKTTFSYFCGKCFMHANFEYLLWNSVATISHQCYETKFSQYKSHINYIHNISIPINGGKWVGIKN